MSTYSQLDPTEQTSLKFKSINFHARRYILIYRLQNVGHFVRALMGQQNKTKGTKHTTGIFYGMKSTYFSNSNKGLYGLAIWNEDVQRGYPHVKFT